MENQMSDDGSLLSVSQVELPVLPGGQFYQGIQTAPVPQSTAGAAGNAAGNEVQVYSRGTLVKQGTVLSGETIVSGANNSMYVTSGGTATSTRVNSGGFMSVSSGGTATATTVNSWGSMCVFSGGTANSTTVNEGYLYVSSGGTATATTVNFWGFMSVTSGGTATSTTVNTSGSLYVGGTANSTTVNSWGFMSVTSGGTANSTTVNEGYLYVSSGGTANSTTVNWGTLCISSGGTATNVIWTPCVGRVSAADGAFVTYASDYSGVYFGAGETLLSHTQTMNGKQLFLGHSMYVMSGGTATDTTVDRGSLYVSSGGTANSTTVNSWGSMCVFSGGTANSTTVNEGYLYVSSGGTANSTTVNWGTLCISSGGTATNVIWTPCVGRVSAADGAFVTYASDYSGVYFGAGSNLVSHTQTMNGKQLFSTTSMYVMSGGTATDTSVEGWSHLYVWSGGSVTSSIVMSGGFLWVFGGIANSTEMYGGAMSVSSGGTVSATMIAGGSLYVGGTANSTTVNSWGRLIVSSGGTATDTTVNYGGWLIVSSGGTATDTTVNYRGTLCISSGGMLKGALQMDAGAVVSAYAGAVIDFTVSERTAADGSLINDLSRIEGAPTYTITVAADQAFGTYKLAQGASSFAGTFTVGDGSVNYGSITVNGDDLVYNDVTYSLDKVGGDLTLTITGITAPEAVEDDLDGNGLADVILRHTRQGFCGAWLTTGDASIIGWGDLSTIGSDVKLLGMGDVSGSSDSGQDIFMLNGNTVAAWVTEEGRVTGYRSLYNANANMNVLGLADFDGDGVTDYLLRSNSGDVGCVMGDGNRWNYFQSLGKEWDIAAVGDFNGDGRDDLVLKHAAGFAGTWLTQENGTVSWRNLDTLSGGLEILGAGDFNGDGVDDILLRKGNWIGAWLVDDGAVDSFIGIKSNLTSTVEQIADFDGDGIDDLRIRDGKDIGVLYVKGADTTQWQYFKSVGTEWSTAFDAQVV